MNTYDKNTDEYMILYILKATMCTLIPIQLCSLFFGIHFPFVGLYNIIIGYTIVIPLLVPFLLISLKCTIVLVIILCQFFIFKEPCSDISEITGSYTFLR